MSIDTRPSSERWMTIDEVIAHRKRQDEFAAAAGELYGRAVWARALDIIVENYVLIQLCGPMGRIAR